MKSLPQVLSIALATFVLLPAGCTAPADSALSPDSQWRSYGRDPGGGRSSPLRQINVENVHGLTRAWSYSTGEAAWMAPVTRSRPAAFECTPLMVDDRLLISTASGRVMALDPASGAELWMFDPYSGRAEPRQFAPNRGVAYWEGSVEGAGPSKRILAPQPDGRIVCLDAESGRPCPDFADAGFLDLRAGLPAAWADMEFTVTSPPAVYRDLMIVGALAPEFPSHGPSGAVRAFDVRSGRPVWTFHTVPHPGEFGSDTWEGDAWQDRTGVNVWSIMSVDPDQGMVFLPIGSPAYDFYGADRPGANLFGNALVALNAATGERLWHFQMVHHDIWDFDLPAQPVLVELEREGRRIPAVVQVTKMGFVFVLDRLTGEPLFPVEERAVPASEVPGEKTWPTQPFPLAPPPLVRIEPLTRDEITLIPESRQECLELFDSAVSGGVYQPAGLELTLSFPGTLGGATWSGASFDPATGLLYVNVNEVGRIARMERRADGSYRRNSPWGEYARFWDSRRWPCQVPPWGTLNAIDLGAGRIRWAVPLGTVPGLEDRGLPATGAPNLGGSIVTAGRLVFVAGTNDRRFRAFHALTGEELWRADLEASGHATPMTYLGRDGRQYVAVAAGGGGAFSPDHFSDVLAVFALPAADWSGALR